MVFITDFNEGDMISNVYLCKNKQTGTTKSGKTYYNLELVDKTGSIAGKVWELSNAIGHFESKNFIKVDGQVTSLTMSFSSISRRFVLQMRENTQRLIICRVPRKI